MFLIVDDDEEVVKALTRRYRGRNDIKCVLCESVSDVEEAVSLCGPEVLIFDHSIRANGQPGGFIIAREYESTAMKLVSNSADATTFDRYARLGILCTRKDPDELDRILERVPV